MKTLIRPNLFGLAISIAIIIAALIVINSPTAHESALLTGDFPAFYSLAKIASSDQHSMLYNLELQTKIQNQNWPTFKGDVLIAVYPPATALILSPLASFTASTAHLIFTSLAVLALAGSLFLILKTSSNRYSNFNLAIVSLAICNPYMLLGTLGGQNTAFSILILIAGALLLESRKKENHCEIISGFVFSLWLLKPQYGLSVFVFLLLAGFRRASLGFIAGSILHFLAGVYLIGINWPLIWLKSIAEFAKINYLSNQEIHTSLLSLLSLLNTQFDLSQGFLVSTITWLLFPMLVISTSIFLHKKMQLQNLPTIYGLLIYISAFPFLVPQAQFYDLGISAFCFLFFAIKQKEFPLVSTILLWTFSWIFILLRESAGCILFPLLSIIYPVVIYRLTSTQKTQNLG